MNVLITRPDERGQALVNLLNEQGIFAIHQPLFNLEVGRELPQLPAMLARLNAGDYVFAVSKNAVDFSVKTLKETGFHFRNDLIYFAVGKNSANYFASHAEQAVRYPLISENSEGLLLLPEMQQLAGKNLLILRAERGREFLAEQAELKGATVHYLECYQRVLTENLSEKMSLAKRSGIDTIVATSSEILTILFEQTAEEDLAWLKDCRLVVTSERAVSLAKRLGVQKITLSDKADNASLLNTLLREN